MPLNADNYQESEGDIGEMNAASYAAKSARGDPLRLKDVAKVTLVDAFIVELIWAFWKPLLLTLGYANLIQAIVVVLVFIDVYLLRKNVRNQSSGSAKKRSDDDSSDGSSSEQSAYIRY